MQSRSLHLNKEALLLLVAGVTGEANIVTVGGALPGHSEFC